MSVAVVFSEIDPVSKGVLELTRAEFRPRRISEFEDYVVEEGDEIIVIVNKERDLPFLDDLEPLIERLGLEVREFIFVSRHEMKSPRPMFTAHVSGNWREAQYGGRDGEVSLADPHLLSGLFRVLCKLKDELGLEGFECHLEATHHGPSITSRPVVYIEQGSEKAHWEIKRGWEVLLHTLRHAINGDLPISECVVIDIGDLHYLTISQDVLRGLYDVGHAIPKHASPITEGMLEMAVSRMTVKPNKAVIHWKSISSGERHLARNFLQRLGVEVVKKGA